MDRLGKPVNGQRAIVLPVDSLNGLGDPLGMAANYRKLTNECPLFALKHAIQDFTDH
ncbi:hypothetical protein D3C76_1027160 [compost metagenome]